MNDGVGYVPTAHGVLFGRQFASIGELGPMLGPAIAVIWGRLPGMLCFAMRRYGTPAPAGD